MKNNKCDIKIWTLFLAMAWLHLGCDSYLDPEPQNDDLTKDVVYGDILQAEKVLNNVYSGVRSGFGNYNRAMLASATDEAANGYNWARTWSLTNGAWSTTNQFDGIWGRQYEYIRKATLFIENVDQVPGNDNLKTRMKAEARFLRSYFYFTLVARYGGVPLITEVLSIEADLALPRNSMEECVKFIVDECDAVADILPSSHGSSDLGRATKGAAMALKSRALLYFASPLHNPSNDITRWENAAKAAKDVIDLNYSLYPDYQELFLKPYNQEVIYAKADYGNRIFDDTNIPSGNHRGGWGGTNPTVNFIESYDMANGKQIDDPTAGYDPDAPLENRDPRLYQTVVIPGETWFGEIYAPWGKDGRTNLGIKPADGTWTGFNLKKYLQESFQSNTRTWIVFRLGEMYLNYAEALNEAKGPVDEVYDALDMLRSRPTVELPPLERNLTQDEMRTRIWKERQVELAFEEHRWFDVRRWKIGEVLGGLMYGYEVTKEPDGTITYEKIVFQERRYDDPKFNLYPIPQSEININENLEQNPFW